MPIVTLPGRIPRVHTQPVSRALFHWRAQDGLNVLTGHPMTFSRAGAGGSGLDTLGKYRAVSPAYNVPRYEAYDLDGDGARESVALLLEGVVNNNSMSASEDCTNASWTKTNLTGTTRTRDSQLAGSSTEGVLYETSATGAHSAGQGVTITAGEYVFISCVIRAWGRARGEIYLDSAGTDRIGVIYDVRTLGAEVFSTAVLGAGSQLGFGGEYLGDGRYLIWAAGKVNAAGTAMTYTLRLFDDTGSSSYPGDATKGTSFTCMQMLRCSTTGPTVQSYIGNSATRTVDQFYAAAGANLFLLQGDFTVYFKIPRPRWADWTGSLITQPYVLRLGNSNPQLNLSFNQSARSMNVGISDSVPNFTTVLSGAMPYQAGRFIDGIMQVKNWLAGGGSVAGDTGAGLSAFSSPLSNPVGALGSDHIILGNATVGGGFQLDGGLQCIKIGKGLMTLQQMRELF